MEHHNRSRVPSHRRARLDRLGPVRYRGQGEYRLERSTGQTWMVATRSRDVEGSSGFSISACRVSRDAGAYRRTRWSQREMTGASDRRSPCHATSASAPHQLEQLHVGGLTAMRWVSIYTARARQWPAPDDGRDRAVHHVERRRSASVEQDRTGGHFDIDLDFTRALSIAEPQVSTGDRQPAAVTGTSIFTAVQEQLGLKLEPARSRSQSSLSTQ